MQILQDIVSWPLLIAGSAFAVIGAVGLLRFPDVYARMHASGITDTLGAGLILAGLMVQSGFSLITVKLILILIFLLYTSPTATYALANAAYSRGLQPVLGKREPETSKLDAPKSDTPEPATPQTATPQPATRESEP